MNQVGFAILLFLIAISSAATASSATITVVTSSTLSSITAEIGLYGKGLCVTHVESGKQILRFDVDKLAAICRFDHDFGPIERVKLLLMAPGFAVATFETSNEAVTWEPSLVRLPVAYLKGRLEPAPATPQLVSVDYRLTEAMEFFGYLDGSSPSLRLGSALSLPDGRFELVVPNLLFDPFVTSRSASSVSILVHAPDRPAPGEATRTYALLLKDLYTLEVVVLDQQRVWPPRK